MRPRMLLSVGLLCAFVSTVQADPAATPTHLLYLPCILRERFGGVHVEEVTCFGGAARHVSVVGDYAYLGQGRGIALLDVSVPGTPMYLGRPAALQGGTHGLAASGSRAVAWGNKELFLLDVAEPEAIAELGSFELETMPWSYPSIQDVALDGNLCYVVVQSCFRATCTWDLSVLDISDPAQPVRSGAAGGGFDCCRQRVAVRGDLAFVAAGGSGLWIYDVARPGQPELLSTCPLPSSYGNLGVDAGDGFAVVAGDKGLRVVDVADPSDPLLAADYETPGDARSVTISGTMALVANDWGMSIFDLSNLASPAELGSYQMPGQGFDVAWTDGRAWVAEGGNLRVLDVTDPRDPVQTGSFLTPGNALSVAHADDHIYVVDAWAGLHTMDVSDPEQPHGEGLCLVPNALDVALSDSLAIVGAPDRLHLVDVMDPEEPLERGSLATAIAVNTVVATGQHAVIGGARGLRVIDAGDPTQPRQVGAYETPGDIHDLAVSGTLAYAANDWGLSIFDLSDPARPTEPGSLRLDEPGRAVAVDEDVAYVAHGEWAVHSIDVSQPAQPTFLGHWDAWNVLAMRVDLGLAFTLSPLLQVADVSDPRRPRLTMAKGPGGVDLAIGDDGYLFVADGEYGLRVLRIWQD